MLLQTGCINIIEEMFLNKDGSGKYHLTIDMSEMVKEDGMMKGFMEQMMQEGLEQDGSEEEAEYDAKSEEKAPNDLDSAFEEKDTIMYMKDLPDSLKQRVDNPKFLEKVSVRQQVSKEKGIFKMIFMLDFDNMADIDYFYENFDKLQGDNQGMAGLGAMGGGGGGFFGGNAGESMFKNKKCVLERLPYDMGGDTFSEEDMQFAQMLFNNATYSTIYHFPGKVKSADIPNAVIDGKTVTVEADLLKILDGKEKLEGIIKYKKK